MLTAFLRSAQQRRVPVASTVAAAVLVVSACATVDEPPVAGDAGGVDANSGSRFYETVTADEWVERVTAAEQLLIALIDSAQSKLVDSFQAILHGVTDPRVETGNTLLWAADETRAVQRGCDRNHTPIHIQAEFGG